ncbi:MAG: 6-phosphogluconolactonase [Chthoniobacterales bacterium]
MTADPKEESGREIIRTGNFVGDAAQFILRCARAAMVERNEFRIALSGGNTPRPVYHELARMGRDVAWERALITFGDERCVPPDDKESNYRMARESLLLPAAVPEASVLRMRGEIDPQKAADEYQEELDLRARRGTETVYRHDLILLGLGDDGHTASLFPETAALEESARGVVANFVPKLESWRLTFTFPLISAAREICFLVNGAKHAELVERVLDGDERFPAARVRSASGRVTWIIGN